MSTIEEFIDDTFYLSNFYECPVTYDGITYDNSEAAFHAQKVMSTSERERFAKLPPDVAKKLGRRVPLRSDWETVKDNYMHEILLAKFTQHPDLKEKLLATGTAHLVEGNTWHDNYWGACRCKKCAAKPKRNQLGIELEKVRDELK